MRKNIYAKCYLYFYPGTHKHDCHAKWTPEESLKNMEALNKHLPILPAGTMVTSEDIDRVVASIADIYNTVMRFTKSAKRDAKRDAKRAHRPVSKFNEYIYRRHLAFVEPHDW